MGIFGGRVSPRGERGVYSSACRPPCALFLWVLVVVALILAAPHVAFASGEERTTVGDDLVIRTDTRWAGGTLGGYLPVRVEISNQAPARSSCSKSRPPTGRTGRRSSGSLAWISTRLSVSRFPFRSRRSDRGCFASTTGEASCHRTCVSLGARRCSASIRRLQCSWSRPGRSIVRVTSRQPAARATRLRFGAVPATDPSALAEVVPPDSLPDSWIDYSGLDFVAISRDDLADLKPSARSAVLKWVHCGGNLIVHQAGKTSKDVETLERLLELNENAAVGARWTESGGAIRHGPLRHASSCSDWSAPFPINFPIRRSPGPHS